MAGNPIKSGEILSLDAMRKIFHLEVLEVVDREAIKALETLKETPFMKVSLFYERLNGGKVRCGVCERRCVIEDGEFGFCGTRVNLEGVLYTVIYGDISSISANPIEKKPLFHFWPGSVALTVGSWSCNFTCPWCQNFEISKEKPPLNPKKKKYIPPERFIDLAVRYGCEGTSISFNEPTLLLEWSVDVFKLARREGLYNTFVSNGYMTEKALKTLVEAGLDAINIDIKGDEKAVKKYCGVDVNYVWRNAKKAKEMGAHVELTTLVIPGVNDSEEVLREIAKRIARELGEDTPWHVTRYYPCYKFNAPPTPVSTLERAREIGVEEGLRFVYIGNVPGHKWENTYCPSCGELLIKRHIFDIVKYNLTDENKCPRCGEKIPIRGRFVSRKPVTFFWF